MFQVTIPANHSAVALLKLAQLPYNGATSLFIRVLLNKKYALPYKVGDRGGKGKIIALYVGSVKIALELRCATPAAVYLYG